MPDDGDSEKRLWARVDRLEPLFQEVETACQDSERYLAPYGSMGGAGREMLDEVLKGIGNCLSGAGLSPEEMQVDLAWCVLLARIPDARLREKYRSIARRAYLDPDHELSILVRLLAGGKIEPAVREAELYLSSVRG